MRANFTSMASRARWRSHGIVGAPTSRTVSDRPAMAPTAFIRARLVGRRYNRFGRFLCLLFLLLRSEMDGMEFYEALAWYADVSTNDARVCVAAARPRAPTLKAIDQTSRGLLRPSGTSVSVADGLASSTRGGSLVPGPRSTSASPTVGCPRRRRRPHRPRWAWHHESVPEVSMPLQRSLPDLPANGLWTKRWPIPRAARRGLGAHGPANVTRPGSLALSRLPSSHGPNTAGSDRRPAAEASARPQWFRWAEGRQYPAPKGRYHRWTCLSLQAEVMPHPRLEKLAYSESWAVSRV
jgi:hypothetical protein